MPMAIGSSIWSTTTSSHLVEVRVAQRFNTRLNKAYTTRAMTRLPKM